MQEEAAKQQSALSHEVGKSQQEVVRLRGQLGADMSQASAQLARLAEQHQQVKSL